MNRYTITLQDRAGASHRVVYDPHASTLRWSSGAPVDLAKIGMAPQVRDRQWQHAVAINGVDSAHELHTYVRKIDRLIIDAEARRRNPARVATRLNDLLHQ